MRTEPIDLYAILGLPRDATQTQISAAYRTLLRRYHPDTRTADTAHDATSDAALQHVLTAYTVLRDPTRRLAYDQQTNPRPTTTRKQAQSVHLSPVRPFDDPPLRAGPVYWTP